MCDSSVVWLSWSWSCVLYVLVPDWSSRFVLGLLLLVLCWSSESFPGSLSRRRFMSSLFVFLLLCPFRLYKKSETPPSCLSCCVTGARGRRQYYFLYIGAQRSLDAEYYLCSPRPWDRFRRGLSLSVSPFALSILFGPCPCAFLSRFGVKILWSGGLFVTQPYTRRASSAMRQHVIRCSPHHTPGESIPMRHDDGSL